MKIAFVADVHGNLPALEAVLADLEREAPDLVVHGGDLAIGGPHPAEVLDRIRELGWPGVLGNTDEVLWNPPDNLPPGVPAAAEATRALLSGGHLDWLRSLPIVWRQGHLVALVHAVPGDVWRVVPADADDATLDRTYRPLGAELAVYCHIHRPYVRRLEGLTVANTGSTGMPFDGDWRASYLVVEDGHCRHRRVEYDLEREVADLRRSGYPNWEGLAAGRRAGAPAAPPRP